MAKININDRMPDFTFDTPFRKNVKLSEAAEGRKIALIFLRYYGCILCRYDLAQYARNYDKIKAAGGKLMVVLQSDPDMLREELGGVNPYPFEIICDPEGKLYSEFDIIQASSMAKLISPAAIVKILKAKFCGIKHGRYEGEELQLPASFVLLPNLTVIYAQYAKTVDEIPNAEQLAKLLSY